MKPSDKFRSDLDRWARDATDPERVRGLLHKGLPSLPSELIDDLNAAFLEKLRGNPRQADKAVEWIGTVVSILENDYDGTPLSDADWRELGQIVGAASGELDLDTLTYAMNLVLEHKGI